MNRLLHAIRNDDLLSVQQVLDKEPHLARESNKFGITPLHEATEVGRLRLVQTLLDHGAEIDAKDKYEHTPLFKAIWFLHYDIVNLLLDRGADIHVRDHSGHTLLHWAASQGEKNMVELLLRHGAQMDATNREGKIPIDYALSGESYDVAELIEIARRKSESPPIQHSRDRRKIPPHRLRRSPARSFHLRISSRRSTGQIINPPVGY